MGTITYLGYETELRGSILAHHNHLKSCVAVYEGAVLGEGCTVGSKAVIKPEIKIWPEKYIESGSVVNSSLVWGLRWGAALFGRQGIEKIANLEFTPEFAAKLGAAVGAVPSGEKSPCREYRSFLTNQSTEDGFCLWLLRGRNQRLRSWGDDDRSCPPCRCLAPSEVRSTSASVPAK